MNLTKFIDQFPVNESLQRASDMAKGTKHPYVRRGGERIYLSEEQKQVRNRQVAEILGQILELPITRPISLDRSAYEPGVDNPWLDTRM